MLCTGKLRGIRLLSLFHLNSAPSFFTPFLHDSETQTKEDEMEKIEVDNKHLEHQVELQVR